MSRIEQYLWLIPALPLLAAGISALAPRRAKILSASLAIGSMGLSLALSLVALAAVMREGGANRVCNFRWFQIGSDWCEIGWLLNPLTAVMIVMVSLVGLLIFIYSLGYMDEDRNCGRFFSFMSLFAAAMLGLVITNSLLVFFICWELVGLTSYLLIGFWFQKPSAAAAARKAFITTRIGDIAFLLGMVWLHSQTGTLLFYDQGSGCLEGGAIGRMVTETTGWGMAVSTGISLLIFVGAMGKSGQLPLHVWLPDAMEGPTPVSALIHAATMVAAGVFLVARLYPLMSATPEGLSVATPLKFIAWIGVLTALFAALVAVAQFDIKRILAYSTVSQLGFMMLGLATGGVAVGVFHLITHACFKALLFLGAGSVIHSCHHEQDIRRLGGLKRLMPITFLAYAVGMMALAGVPVFFSGFWSKDAILHAAHGWSVSSVPFYLAVTAAFLTAFYMTRQMIYVFFGQARFPAAPNDSSAPRSDIHESPAVMTSPLLLLAACAIGLGFVGTPAWPWFQAFLERTPADASLARLLEPETLKLMVLSLGIVLAGIGTGMLLYRTDRISAERDNLEKLRPDVWSVLAARFYCDEVYEATVVRLTHWFAGRADWLETYVFSGLVRLTRLVTIALAWISKLFDESVINFSFDKTCRGLMRGGTGFARWQTGQAQFYLRWIALGVILLILWLGWEWSGS